MQAGAVNIVALGLLGLTVSACTPRRDTVVAVPGGHPDRGEQAFVNFGCGSCHAIDGWGKPKGHVGPPLSGIAERTMIAGELPNTPENMMRWIQNPQAIEPNTAMPNLGVSEPAVRDIVAYLYTLR